MTELTASSGLPSTPTRFAPSTGPRVVALDGVRGAMTLMVLLSHYFGELEHGIKAFCFGWIAVIGFFALSGFLIGRLILDRKHHANFVVVFYARRFLRMMPALFVVLFTVFGLYALIGDVAWADKDVSFPFWTYATFTQNFYMIHTDSIGPHWLAPTWTLAVEEHFYLVIPATLLFTPQRHLLRVLLAIGVTALLLRIAVFGFGLAAPMNGRVLLPMLADTLVCGLIAAALLKSSAIDWARYDTAIRVLPVIMLSLASLCAAIDGADGALFSTVGTTFIAIGAGALLIAIMRGAPEAKRFTSKFLCFFGHTSYAVYLTHLTVLGMMHGLILGTRPDIATWPQVFVTLAALPVATLVGWILYKAVEEPCMHLAMRWTWSREAKGTAAAPAPQGPALAS
jgi:peptidoglycan/LPS O-acetylase OafA/YrhL